MDKDKLELLVQDLKWLEASTMLLESAIKESDDAKKEKNLDAIKKRLIHILESQQWLKPQQ